MASLTFNNLKNTTTKSQNYTYVDLWLDIDPYSSYDSTLKDFTRKTDTKDIKVAYDLNAIKNSLTNLFNTIPGNRILLPDYGLNLRKFIFEPMSQGNAINIGRLIKDGITRWEPRCTVININVDAYMDRQEYVITLNLAIPFLNQSFNFTGLLNNNGYSFIVPA